MTNFLQTVAERVVVYDGAMGTNIQKRNPTLDDYWGKENCSEVLVLSRPDIIRDIHADFLRVGCDIVETNTFGGTSLVLGEFDLRDKVREINLKAAQLAREVAQQFSTRDATALCRRIDGADYKAAFAGTHRIGTRWLRLTTEQASR
jgi:5-methyltetrahydrofolate--homocysteine methyltransferase